MADVGLSGDDGLAHSDGVAAALASLDPFSAATLLREIVTTTRPLSEDLVSGAVEVLLKQMLSAGLACRMPVKEIHADGMYARELRIQAGTFAVGEIQKRPHINVLSAGRISMLGPRGGLVELSAPCTFYGTPGVRKVGFVHEDVVWTTVHNMADWAASVPAAEAGSLALECFIAARTTEEYRLHCEATTPRIAP